MYVYIYIQLIVTEYSISMLNYTSSFVYYSLNNRFCILKLDNFELFLGTLCIFAIM